MNLRHLLPRAQLPAVLAGGPLENRVRPDWLRPVRRQAGAVAVPVRIDRLTWTELRTHAELLAVAFRVRAVEVEQDGPAAGWLWLLPEDAAPLPYAWTAAPPALGPARPTAVPLGVSTTGHPVLLPLWDEAGGISTLVGGMPGAGKTNALRVIAAGAVARSCVTVVWLDAKGGGDSRPFRDRALVVPDSADAAVAADVLGQVAELMQLRQRLAGLGVELWHFAPVLLLVDEWAVTAQSGSKEDRAAAADTLRTLVTLGRAQNLSVVLATQRPTSSTIDVPTRSMCTNRLALACEDTYSSHAVLGAGRPEAAALSPRRDRGSAYLTDGGPLTRLRLFDLPAAAVTADRIAGPADTLPELVARTRAALADVERST